MNRLRRFFGLPAADRRRLARTLCVVAFVRLALCVLPFRLLRAFIARMVRQSPVDPGAPGANETESPVRPEFESATAARVSWSVRRVSRFIPGATCLTRALAVQALLAREGVASTLRFGVGRGDGKKFRAHAWLECVGRVVIGGDEDLTRFAPLPQFTWSARPGGRRLKGTLSARHAFRPRERRRCDAMEG